LATSHFQLGNLASVIATCEEGLDLYDSASLYRLLAFAHRSQKNWALEKDALENQLRLSSGDAYAHYRLGLLLSLDDPDRAFAVLRLAASLDPQVDSAVQTLHTALTLSANQTTASDAKVTIGRALGLVQEWDLALLAFGQAVELDPNHAEAWAWLGEAKQQTGQSGSVELDKALSLDRASVNVRALRGLYWNRLGKYEQALAEYLLAAGIEPENPRWQASIGEAYAHLGKLPEALMAYQRATELAPQEAAYWSLLAVFCAERGVYVEEIGLPAAQQAVSLAPTDPSALDALGFSYLSSGRFASAEQALAQAIALAPNYFPAHIHLAMTYLAQGNRSAAFNSLTFVRDADDSGVYVNIALQLLAKYFP
jgi:tetratricopeptide (TPR) repeat protein